MKKIILLILVFAIMGCGARKRDAEKHKLETNYNNALDSLAILKTQIKGVKSSNEESTSVKQQNEIVYEGKQGDSLTVTEIGPDGKIVKQTKFSGSGSAKIGSSEEKATNKKAVEEKTEASISSEVQLKKESSGSKKQSDSSVHLKREGNAAMWWVILIVLILIILFYLNYRFKWFFWAKKHVLNKNQDSDTFAL